MNRNILGLRRRGGRLSAILCLVVPLLLLSTAAQAAAPAGTTYTTPFALYCGGTGPACTPLWTITVLTGRRFGIEYQIAPGHCASFYLHVYVDGKQVASRTMGSPRTPGPLDTGVIAVSSAAPEAHVIGLQAVAFKNGCVVTRIAAWGGTVTLTGVTLPTPVPFTVYCKIAATVCQPPWTTTVKTGRLLQIDYHNGIQCAPIELRILLDGRVVGTKDMGYGDDPQGRPLDSGPITIAPLTPGTHVIGLEAVGIKGGCNGAGTLSAWGGSVFLVH